MNDYLNLHLQSKHHYLGISRTIIHHLIVNHISVMVLKYVMQQSE